MDAQIALFDESQLPSGRELLLPLEEQRHRFTGGQVRLNQERYAALVSALGEGLGVRQICRAFKVSPHTLETIRERDAELVATEKERSGRKLRRLVRMTMDRLEEALANDEITAGQLPVTLGILVDKSLAFEGQAVATVTVRHEIDQEQVRRMFQELQGPVIDVESAPIGHAPDFGSGAIPQNGQQKQVIEPVCEVNGVNLGARTGSTAPELSEGDCGTKEGGEGVEFCPRPANIQ